jgi:hypothetical protein
VAGARQMMAANWPWKALLACFSNKEKFHVRFGLLDAITRGVPVICTRLCARSSSFGSWRIAQTARAGFLVLLALVYLACFLVGGGPPVALGTVLLYVPHSHTKLRLYR